MKLKYITKVYEGPETKEHAITLAKCMNKKDWQTYIYDGDGQDFTGEIYRIIVIDGKKYKGRELGTIEKGRIETHDYDKGLEKFLENYEFNELKGGEIK